MYAAKLVCIDVNTMNATIYNIDSIDMSSGEASAIFTGGGKSIQYAADGALSYVEIESGGAVKSVNGLVGEVVLTAEDVGAATKDSVEALKKDIDELKGEELTIIPDIPGVYNVSYGIVATTAHSFRTDYIPLNGYTRISAKTHIINSCYALAFFDSNMALLKDISILGAGVNPPNIIDMPIPNAAKYCMLSNYAGSNGNNKAYITLYTDDEKDTGNIRGKIIAFLGDSISSVNYTQPNYWQLIAEKTEMIPLNYGVSASRIAQIESDTVESFIARANNMSNNADAVLVMGGTNDCNLGTKLGEWNSTDTTTFYGALNELINILRTKYVGKPIIFSTPIKRKYDVINSFPYTMEQLKTADATKAITMEQCVLAIKAKCAANGIPVVDCHNYSGIGANCAEYYRDNDNLHPSTLGEIRIANMIQAELEKQLTHTIA